MLSFLADPAEPVLGAVLRVLPAAEIVSALCAGDGGRAELVSRLPDVAGLDRVAARWQARVGLLPTAARLAAWERSGLRLVVPGDAEWPTQLDDLGDARPLLLWVRGTADLRYCCLRSVSVVGARAATAYGVHVGTELAASLAEHDLVTISGGP
jgi:DNA processing protein